MHIAQLLDHLFASVDVEVIKPNLKKMALLALSILLFSVFSPQAELIPVLAQRRQQALRRLLL